MGRLPFSQSPSPSHLVSSAVAYSGERKREISGKETEIQFDLILNVRQATAQGVELEVTATAALLSPLLVVYFY